MTLSLHQAYIAKICAKTNSVPVQGFIAPTSRNILSTSTLQTLYISQVWPILDQVNGMVRAPHQTGHCDHLNIVQMRFLWLLGVRSGVQFIWLSRTLLTSSRSSRQPEEQPLTWFSYSRLSIAQWTVLNFCIGSTSTQAYLLEFVSCRPTQETNILLPTLTTSSCLVYYTWGTLLRAELY